MIKFLVLLQVWWWGAVWYDRWSQVPRVCQSIPVKITHLHNVRMVWNCSCFPFCPFSAIICTTLSILWVVVQIAAGSYHVLALSEEMRLYFWGHHAWEQRVATPTRIEVPNVKCIGATRGCSISAFKTTEVKVYYWGFAFGHYIAKPVATKYNTIIELFASLDSPMMLGPVTFDMNQPTTEMLKSIFADSVRSAQERCWF